MLQIIHFPRNVLVKHVVTEDIELVEKTHKEKGIGNDIVETKDIRLLFFNGFMTLSTHSRTTFYQIVQTITCTSEPSGLRFRGSEEECSNISSQGRREIKWDIKQLCKNDHRSYPELLQSESLQLTTTKVPTTLVELSCAYTVKCIQNVTDEIESGEQSIGKCYVMNLLGIWVCIVEAKHTSNSSEVSNDIRDEKSDRNHSFYKRMSKVHMKALPTGIPDNWQQTDHTFRSWGNRPLQRPSS